MESDLKSSLEGLRVVSFESRRAREMGELIRNYGGEPFIGPAMREIPLDENRAAVDFIDQLQRGNIDYLILMTGVGTRALIDAVAGEYTEEKVVAALEKTSLVVRGPKPIAVLKELRLLPAIRVPEPNTWREILAELDSQAEIRGKRVAVQEYGVTNKELISGLEARGAQVVRVPIYRWALPEDTGPLRFVLKRILDRQADIVIFTNATQVAHLFQLAKAENMDILLRQSLGNALIVSIGPICTEAIEQFDLRADLEPEHPKMGHLMSTLGTRGRNLLQAKRAK